MDQRDIDFETYEKPTRAIRKSGKKKSTKDKLDRVPRREAYKRQHLTAKDLLADLDDEE